MVFFCCCCCLFECFLISEPPWTDPGIKSRIHACELISTSIKNIFKKCKNEWSGHFQKILASEEKATPTPVSKSFILLCTGHMCASDVVAVVVVLGGL